MITNNQAGYEAVNVRILLAKEMGVECLKLKTDSQLVVAQIQGESAS